MLNDCGMTSPSPNGFDIKSLSLGEDKMSGNYFSGVQKVSRSKTARNLPQIPARPSIQVSSVWSGVRSPLAKTLKSHVALRTNEDRDMSMRRTFGMLGREECIASITHDLTSIVDGIIAHNKILKGSDRSDLFEILTLFVNNLPIGALNSISRKDLETQVEQIILEEAVLSPGLIFKMPYRNKTTIDMTIKSITRGYPTLPNFED